MNETPPTDAAGAERLPICPTAGSETPDPRQRADVVLVPPLTVRENEIAEIGRRRRTVAALRRGNPPPGA